MKKQAMQQAIDKALAQGQSKQAIYSELQALSLIHI